MNHGITSSPAMKQSTMQLTSPPNHASPRRSHVRRGATLGATALGAGVLLALGAPLAASAHVTADPSSTAAGSYTVTTFSVGHGCEGSPTTEMAIEIPEGVASVTPTINPGWSVDKVSEPIEDSSGGDAGERVTQVVYTADTPLVDGYRTTFALEYAIPEDAAGQTMVFPTVQTCEAGSTNWNEPVVEGEAEPEHPAPSFLVTEATADGGHDGGEGDSHAESDDHEHSGDSAETAGTSGSDAASAESTDAAAARPADDVLARILGIGGLVVGVVAIVIALASRRPSTVDVSTGGDSTTTDRSDSK